MIKKIIIINEKPIKESTVYCAKIKSQFPRV